MQKVIKKNKTKIQQSDTNGAKPNKQTKKTIQRISEQIFFGATTSIIEGVKRTAVKSKTNK